jgi:hypothetical protein
VILSLVSLHIALLRFQENLLRTMIQIENSFFDLASTTNRDCLLICDRGTMDASAFIGREQWEHILARNGWDEVEIRDNRYNQVCDDIYDCDSDFLIPVTTAIVSTVIARPRKDHFINDLRSDQDHLLKTILDQIKIILKLKSSHRSLLDQLFSKRDFNS